MIRQELLPYIEAAKLIAKAFGPDCEVIVHDLSVPQHSVVFVENNVVTGRHVGDSFGHLVQKARELGSEDGILANYYYRRDGRLIRSSSLLIRDNDGKLIGAVTHVFVNDPTKGYGIFIENMLANWVWNSKKLCEKNVE
mgnify:CR=1 FL=1